MSHPRGRVTAGAKLARIAPAAAVVSVALLVSSPAWLTGTPAGSDTVFHASWYRHFSEQFWAGELYPRWLAGMNQGLGSPVFFYYPPLSHYLTSLLGLFVPAGDHGLRHLAYGTALSFVASGLACYFWLRGVSTRLGASVGSILYLLAPYHSVVNPYPRGAYSELWAFVVVPLVLHFARRVASERGAGLAFAGLALSYAALACTHLPATVVFSAVPPVYAYFASGRRGPAPPRALAALALGAGLAAVYLAPALLMQDAASFKDMLADRYYERWVTFARANPRDIYGLLLWGALSSAALVVCAFVLRRERRAPEGDAPTGETSSAAGRGELRAELIFWAAVAALSIFMTSYASDPVWRLLPVLQKVQFPWRFQLVLCVAVAGAAAAGVGSLGRRFASANVRALVFASLISGCWFYFWADAALNAYPDLPRPRQLAQSDLRWLDRSRDAPEYRPALAISNAEQDVETLLQNLCGSLRREPRACVVEGAGTVTVTRAAPRSIDLRVESAGDLTFRVTQFHFPGWAARLDGRPHPVAPARPDGLLLLTTPPGTHAVSLTLEPTKPERVGRAVSLLSALLLALLSARAVLHRLGRRVRARAPAGR